MFKKAIIIGCLIMSFLTIANVQVVLAAPTPDPAYADFIPLLVKIPLPGCTSFAEEKGEKILQCAPDGIFVVAVKDAPSFVVALFRLGINFVAILLVGAIVVAGVMYMTSFGDAKRAQTAVTNIKNALYALVVTIFAYTILYQIDPRLTSLTIPKLVCCEMPDKSTRGTTDVKCAELEGTALNPEACKIDLICEVIQNEPDCKKETRATCFWLGKICTATPICSQITTKEICIANQDKLCQWLDTKKGQCIETRNPNTGDCSLTATSNDCPSQAGCTYVNAGCLPIDPQFTSNVQGCFQNTTTPEDCANKQYAGIDCEWKGGCILSSLALTATAPCESYTADNCPTTTCYKSGFGGTCTPILSGEDNCTVATQCGSLNFCGKDGKCIPKLGENASCLNLTLVGSNDDACLSGKCEGECRSNP